MTDERFVVDKFASDYKLFPLAYPHYWELQKQIVSNIGLATDTTGAILEIGCGSGQTTGVLAGTYKNAQIISIDGSPGMIADAKRELRSVGDRLILVESDALDYLSRRETASLDAVVSGWTLHNFDHRYRTAEHTEIHRVLRPGGFFVNGDKYALDNVDDRAAAFNWSIQRYLEVYPAMGRTDLAYDWIVHMGEDEHPDRLMVESVAKHELARLGFTDIKTHYRMQMEAVVCARK